MLLAITGPKLYLKIINKLIWLIIFLKNIDNIGIEIYDIIIKLNGEFQCLIHNNIFLNIIALFIVYYKVLIFFTLKELFQLQSKITQTQLNLIKMVIRP